jgi:predicted nucleic acid-binding Zn ribbon protein
MPVYLYETLNTSASVPPRRFEVQQKMSDPPLTQDPQTGEPVHRVISGGLGFMGAAPHDNATLAQGNGQKLACGHTCGCHPH